MLASTYDASNTNGDAPAFVVLSSPLYFRLITPFASGWPYFMLRRYNELKPTKGNNVFTWSPTEFLCALLKLGELPMAKQVLHVMWPHETRLLTINERCAAIESGDAETVRWAFDHAEVSETEQSKHVFYKTAIAAFPGHYDVLNIVKQYAPLSPDRLFTLLGVQWRKLCTNIESIRLIQWIIDNLGVASLPHDLFQAVALTGRLAMVEFLLTLPEQHVDEDVYLWFYCRHRRTMEISSSHNATATAKKMLALLLTQRNEPHGRMIEKEAALTHGDVETLQLIHKTQGLVHLNSSDLNALAAKGDLATLQFVLENTSATCTQATMDGAASSGQLAVVQYLHASHPQGCTTAAMDDAAANSHFQVVEFLHANRTEGCTTRAMDKAASNGHLEIVQFLHTHRQEGCTTRAMLYTPPLINTLPRTLIPAKCSFFCWKNAQKAMTNSSKSLQPHVTIWSCSSGSTKREDSSFWMSATFMISS